MSKAVTTILIIIVLIILGVVLLGGGRDAADTDNGQNATSTNDEMDTEPRDEDTMNENGTSTMSEDSETITVTYDGSAYTPASVTVGAGDTVEFVNESDGEMWPASDIHPTHEQYDGTSRSEHCGEGEAATFDACERLSAGESWSFTFEKTGEWAFHDHVRPSAEGVVTVQ